jgi:hypothetical protein
MLCLCVCLLAAGIVVQVEVGCPSLQTVRGEQKAYFCPGSGRQLNDRYIQRGKESCIKSWGEIGPALQHVLHSNEFQDALVCVSSGQILCLLLSKLKLGLAGANKTLNPKTGD